MGVLNEKTESWRMTNNRPDTDFYVEWEMEKSWRRAGSTVSRIDCPIGSLDPPMSLPIPPRPWAFKYNPLTLGFHFDVSEVFTTKRLMAHPGLDREICCRVTIGS